MIEASVHRDIPEPDRVLLAGDFRRVFGDSSLLPNGSVEAFENVLDAISAAADGQYCAVGVVAGEVLQLLAPALKAFRQANPDLKIVMLVRIHQEPAARAMTSGAGEDRLADDYMIYPLEPGYFLKSLRGSSVKTPRVPVEPVDVARATGALQERVAELERLATEDDLTGLKNRRYIWEFGRQIIELAAREGGRVTLLVFDIDDFKHYNDTYGHAIGDEILREAGVLMKRCCRGHDIVGRIGGDEFAVLFWDDPSRSRSRETDRRSATAEPPTEAIFISQRFRRELENAEPDVLGPGGEGVLSISGGLASFPRDGSSIQELFVQADEALLEAKRSGKNRIYIVGERHDDIEKLD